MIGLIDYGAGNIGSIANILNQLDVSYVISNSRNELIGCDKVVFPGVGEARSAMSFLHDSDLVELIPQIRTPFLGICLGMQLLCMHTEENDVKGLGVFNVNVKKFKGQLKVPHMGWNNFSSLKGPLMSGVDVNDDVYYVHSYYAEIGDCTTSKCDYILPFSAALQKDNFYGVQFHPEKSGKVGKIIIKNFLEI